MPSADARAGLPRQVHHLVGCPTLHVPGDAPALVVVEDLTEQHSLVLALVGGHAMVVEAGRNLQARVRNRPERQHRDIEIEQVGVVTANDIERAVVEIADKGL